MSCMWCARFHRDNGPTIEHGIAYLTKAGLCTLSPETVEVSGSYVCGSFTWKDIDQWNINGPSTPVAELWLRLTTNRSSERELRKDVRRLKEANKALRAKLKAVKEPAS